MLGTHVDSFLSLFKVQSSVSWSTPSDLSERTSLPALIPQVVSLIHSCLSLSLINLIPHSLLNLGLVF